MTARKPVALRSTLWVMFLVMSVSLANAQELSGKVVGVHDGDTLTLLVGKTTYKVRLAEIDAPELGQAFGKISRQFLSDLVYGQSVTVVTQGQDQYGRTIGTVMVGGQSPNRQMVAAGLAWHYKAYSKDASLGDLENQARASRIGLWADKAPVPPWSFRKVKK